MVTIQPQTIAESLSKRIADYQYKRSIPELVLRSFKKDANNLMEISPTHAYHFLGQIAALEYDADAVMKNYALALEYSDSAIVYYNYAVSLIRVGENALALKTLKKGFEILGNNIELARVYLNAFGSFFSLSYIQKLIPLFVKFRIGIPTSIEAIVTYFKEYPLEEHILETLMVKTRNTIFENGIMIGDVITHLRTENDLLVGFELSDFKDLEQVFECNYQLLDIKVSLEDEYNVDLSNIIISCEVK